MSPLIPKRRIWPTIVIAVLVIDVVVGLVLIRVATSDPHAAIEADYYQKAVTWDSTLAQASRNSALGWTLDPTLGAISASHEAPFTLLLHDGTGAVVTGASILIEAMQVAHADDIVRAALLATPNGGYGAALPIGRPGLWEVRIVATRGSDRFTADIRLDASTTGAARLVSIRPGDAPAGP